MKTAKVWIWRVLKKKEEWQNLVKNGLSSYSSFLNTVEGYDFIEGPLVVDGGR